MFDAKFYISKVPLYTPLLPFLVNFLPGYFAIKIQKLLRKDYTYIII